MNNTSKTVNGFHFMPPSLAAWIGKDIPEEDFQGDIPWTPMKRPLNEITFALVTSAGINMKTDAPFDMDGERENPLWGDPSFRTVSAAATSADIDANHLHINTDYIRKDINVILPLSRFQELAGAGEIGALAPTAYSFYGYQPDPTELLADSVPQIIGQMKAEGVDAAFLTPA